MKISINFKINLKNWNIKLRLFEENSEYINDNSILELIYVVADGEGSEVERQLVFSTIANNTELQKEFQNAIKMNKVGELEIQNSTPPAHLTNNLMSNLGFDEEINLHKNNEELKLESKHANKYKFNSLISKSIILLLLLFSSAYVGYILGENQSISLTDNNHKNNELLKNQEKIINDLTAKVEKIILENKQFENNLNNNNLNQNSNNNLTQKSYLVNNTKQNDSNKAKNIYEITENNLLAEKITEKETFKENQLISQVNPILYSENISNNKDNRNLLGNGFKNRDNNLINIINTNKNQNRINNNYIAENQIDFLDLLLQLKNSVFTPNLKNKKQNDFIQNDGHNLTVNKDWIFQFNTKNDFQFSHDLFSENINNQLRSFEMIALYKIDDNLYLGGKIGSEYLPIYYIKNEKYDLVKSFYQVSGNLRYVLPNQKFIIEDLLQPYINFSLGGASSGLISGFGIGSNVYIYSNVNLSFGVEINNLTYFNNNGYFNINKTSTNIGLSYIF